MSQPKDSQSTPEPGEPKTWRPDAPSPGEPKTWRPDAPSPGEPAENRPKEYGGRKNGLDPTRYGDWEKNGRCIDF